MIDPPASNGRGIAFAAIAVAVVAAIGFFLSRGSTAVGAIEIGQCFDSVEGDTIDSVDDRDCAEEHLFEAYAKFDLAGDVFPGEETVEEQAFGGCVEEFDRFVGLDYAESELDVFALYPTADSWNGDGDRGVTCSVASVNGAPLVGSQRGVAR